MYFSIARFTYCSRVEINQTIRYAVNNLLRFFRTCGFRADVIRYRRVKLTVIVYWIEYFAVKELLLVLY